MVLWDSIPSLLCEPGPIDINLWLILGRPGGEPTISQMVSKTEVEGLWLISDIFQNWPKDSVALG